MAEGNPILHFQGSAHSVLSKLRIDEVVQSLNDQAHRFPHACRVFHAMCLGIGPRSFETATKTIRTSKLRGSGRPC